MRVLAAITLALSLSSAVAARCEEAVDYNPHLSGVENGDIADKIKEDSRLFSLEKRPPASLIALRHRADADKKRIRAVLRSEGYYDGHVTITLDEKQQPIPVEVTVDLGAEYHLTSYDIELEPPSGTPAPKPVARDRLGIKLGERAQADSVVKAQEKLLHILAERGYPLAKVADRRVIVDHADKEMRVTLIVDTGPFAGFGPVTITGLKHVDEAWVRNRIPWKTGEQFDVTDLDKLRKRLVDSRLFSSVRLSMANHVNAEGLLPVTIALTEGKSRSVGGGASWSTTEGFGGNAFWEDRNLLGGAERLRAEAIISQIREALTLSYVGPDLRVPGEDFIASTRVEKQITDAYTTRIIGANGGLSWELGETWRLAASTAFERELQEREGINSDFTLVSLPLELRHDSTNDLLNPSRGDRLIVTEQPFLDLVRGTTAFNRFELYDRRYLKVLNKPWVVLAGWTRFGTIQAPNLFDVPADKRFYVGGAGSVRGFGYQKAGPIDLAGVPVGGESELAFGGEVRLKITDSIGVVPFVEGGRAFEQSLPDFGQELFWGAGLGVRYYTSIGPVRADVAVPLNPRPGIDDGYQVYFSLGQAF